MVYHLSPITYHLFLLLFLLPLNFCTAYWEETVDVRFSGTELRDTLQQYAKIQRIGFLLDRRADPGIPLEFTAQKVSGAEMLTRLADQTNLEFCRVGEIAYLGPKDAAEKLRRICALKRQSLPRESTASRRMLTQKIPLQTKKLDTPQEILQVVAKKMRTKIVNLDLIPHDLWPELDFPEADAYEVLSILLIGFDLTFQIDESGVTFVPLPDDLPEATALVAETKPATSKTPSSPSKNGSLDKQRFQMVEVKNKTVDEILQYFSSHMDLQITVDEKALQKKGISLDKRISFQRDEADIHELLQATLDPVGCTYQLSGKKLRVFPKK